MEASEITPVILVRVRVARTLVFYVVFCKSLFVLLPLTIVLSVLLFTTSDYPFGIFKLVLDLLRWMILWTCSDLFYRWCWLIFLRSIKLLIFRTPVEFTPGFFGGVRVAHLFSFLCLFKSCLKNHHVYPSVHPVICLSFGWIADGREVILLYTL